MTDRAALGVKPQGVRRWPAWLWWPISFVLVVAGGVGFYNDAVAAKAEWLYWTAVVLLAVFYAVVAVVYLVRLARWAWHWWAEFVSKARGHDALQTKLANWEKAAGEATARAEDAEARVATWHRDGLREGRRRLLGELRASAVQTTFRKIEVAVSEQDLVIGAKWSGQLPGIDARYVMRSTTLKEPKAVLESVEIRADHTVVFRVESVVSEAYRSHLVARASAPGSILKDVEISPRQDELEEEPIWPEN